MNRYNLRHYHIHTGLVKGFDNTKIVNAETAVDAVCEAITRWNNGRLPPLASLTSRKCYESPKERDNAHAQIDNRGYHGWAAERV